MSVPDRLYTLTEKDELVTRYDLDPFSDFWTLDTPDGPRFRIRPHVLARLNQSDLFSHE